MFNLADKNILVTGASRGLGQVCAQALAAQGAKLALFARNENALEEVRRQCANPERHFAVVADFCNMDEVRAGTNRALDGFGGRIDCVLHVAGGGLGLRDRLLGGEDFLRLFTLNMASVAEINRLVAPGMISRREGNLVHVASIASVEATGSVGYNTSKAAMAAYVRTLGRELAPDGVVATGILPGGFYAPGNSWVRLEQNKPEVVQNFIKERLPRGYLAQPEELVPLVLFLCSGAASMMGGCMVPIDAGEGRAYA